MTARAMLPTFSARGTALLRTFQAAFAALEDHRKLHPDEHAQIAASCASHLKNAAPMSMLDTGPVARVEPEPAPAVEVTRELADGGRYTVIRAGAEVTVDVTDFEGDHAVFTLNPVETIRFRADIASVASSAGGTRG